METTSRHSILDIGRFLAILSVMLFHYFSAWANRGDTAYPYGDAYDYFSLGHLGVQFFFILTGFFIIDSLKRSKSFGDFWKKKLVRLGIPLVLCSIATFVVFRLLDSDGFIPASSQWKNLLVSCQLISFNVINLLFGSNVEYINHSYWFLWVEFQFLLLVSLVYFGGRKNFVRNFGIASFVLCFVWYIVRRLLENYFLTNKLGLPFSAEAMLNVKDWLWTLNLPVYIFYLVFGLGCSFVSKKEYKQGLWLLPTICMSLVSHPFFSLSSTSFVIYGILSIWILYAIAPLRIIVGGGIGRLFATLGKCSYSVYLLHEYIGVLFIHRYAYLFGTNMWILPVLLIIGMFVIGYVGYNYIEKTLTKILLHK